MAWASFRDTVVRVRAEFRQWWPFGLFLLGFGASWGIAVMLTNDLPDRFRYFGTVLQVGGIALVAYGLRDLHRAFGRPGMFAAMRARIVALLRAIRSGDKHVALIGNAALGIAGSLAVARGRVRGSIEQRLDGLEREIDDIRKQADEREQKLRSEIGELRTALSNESQTRKDAHAAISAKLDSVAFDEWYLDVIGLMWLFVATVATCIPDEIGALF